MTSSITGIPTSRVTESFTRAQILRQSQFTQLALSKLQTQLSSGLRFENPSEDPIAAMQVLGLQRLIHRKDQVKTNLETTQSYLGSTDTALSSVANLLTQARVTALSVVGTTATATQRQTAAQQIDQTIKQLLNVGNQQFRGRYLFSGSESLDAPFQTNSSGMVEYFGNDQHLLSYSDLNLLTSSNVTGNEAFGVISGEVKGTSTITPTLTYDTRLADLRQGQGISQGSIAISDGQKTPNGALNEVTIDLSGAKTIGDVAALIKAHPPEGRQLYVDITGDKLRIRLDPALGGNLTICEVGSGTVAEELGIRNETGTGTAPIVGRPLQPILRTTTSLDNLFGGYATAVVHSQGLDNDIQLKADVMGETTTLGGNVVNLNGVRVVFLPDNSVQAGSEFVDPINNDTVTVHVAVNGSQAYQVVAALNKAYVAGTIPFKASIDRLDDVNGGLGYVDSNASANTDSSGFGRALDKNHGLRIVNNGKEQTIDFTSAKTLGDVLNIINGSGTGALAEINQGRNGINLLSKVSGCDFEVGENGGITATQFGVRSLNDLTTPLSDLNFGQGVGVATNSSAVMAEAALNSTANNANLIIRAKASAGDPQSNYWNGFAISLKDTGDVPPSVTYDRNAGILTVGIKLGTTTANDVVTAVNTSAASADFAATTANNANGSVSDGSGTVDVGRAVTKGGTPTGNDFTITRSDGTILYIDISGMKTVKEVVDAINQNANNLPHATPLDPNPANLLARMAKYGNGIELVDRSGGEGEVVVTKNIYSQAAIDLGLVPQGKSASNPGISDHAATLISNGDPQSGVLLRGRDPSAPVDGVKVVFAQNADPNQTEIGVVYSESTRTLTVGFPANTTAQQLVTAINDSSAAVLFEAELAPIPNDGTGLVEDNAVPFTLSGGSATRKAQATAVFPTFNHNDLTFTTTEPTPYYEGVQIKFQGTLGGPLQFSRVGNVITVNYDSTPVTGTNANQIVAGWGNVANWLVDDPARTELTVALDPADGTPNLGQASVTDATAALAPVSSGVKVVTGADVNPQETQGVFTALLRLRDAILANDVQAMQRSVEILDESTNNLNYTRAELGARQQGLNIVQDHLESENIDLQGALSQNHDVDIVQVVSDLAARQAAYQASLMSLGKIMQLSLLNYL